MNDNDAFLDAAQQLIDAGRFMDSKGWVPATSGNFSARLPDGRIAMTISGQHKGRLQLEDIMVIDGDAVALEDKKPSAESLLHTALYKRFPDVRSVVHAHTLNAILVSKVFKSEIVLEDYELLKALHGITTHESKVVVPVFANDQNIPRLAARVEQYLDRHADCYGYLIAGHGLYCWGDSVQETLRHLEALDFLFDCELRLHGVNN